MTLVVPLADACRGGENWPSFHGPTHDNHSDATGLPLEWSESKNIVWKTAIHDTGWSSPVVWGNQIWLTTATDDGRASFVLCIDRDTGAVLHDVKLFDNDDPEDTRKYNSFASCTPAIEEGRVYVHFGSYGTACLETRNAEVVWMRRDLPCRHYRGPGSSPLLWENLLILHYDGYDVQYVVALDRQTGQTVWKKDRDYDFGTDDGDHKKAYATPIVIEAAGRTQLISPASKAAVSYDPRTGTEYWRIHYPGFSAAARPIYACGLVFINSGFPRGEMFAVRPDGAGDVTKTHLVWQARKSIPSKPTSLVIGERLYSIDDTGVAACLAAPTGKVIFTQRLGGEFSASPLFADGRIYLSDHAGKTTVIAPSETWELLATNELETGCHASPAVSGRSIILRTEKHLYRIEQRN